MAINSKHHQDNNDTLAQSCTPRSFLSKACLRFSVRHNLLCVFGKCLKMGAENDTNQAELRERLHRDQIELTTMRKSPSFRQFHIQCGSEVLTQHFPAVLRGTLRFCGGQAEVSLNQILNWATLQALVKDIDSKRCSAERNLPFAGFAC